MRTLTVMTTRYCTLLMISLAFLLAHPQAAKAGDAGKGKNLYAPCAACHGSQGEGNADLDSPALAGQDPAYLRRQLDHFKAGSRGSDPTDVAGAQMRPMAATLPDAAAMDDVVAYIETLTGSSPGSRSDSAAAVNRNGENQYNAACGACHGASAEGNRRLNAPRLAGLDADYLRRQYQNYASGLRGGAPGDTYGQQMQMMATMLATDQDLEDVINFILAQ